VLISLKACEEFLKTGSTSSSLWLGIKKEKVEGAGVSQDKERLKIKENDTISLK
jgi:hypothetical protein